MLSRKNEILYVQLEYCVAFILVKQIEPIKKRKMKTVLITGANKGIGFETAKQLAQLGYFVYLGSRDRTKGLDAMNKLKGLGISNVELIEIDVTNADSIKQARLELENKIETYDYFESSYTKQLITARTFATVSTSLLIGFMFYIYLKLYNISLVINIKVKYF